jgi:hypothetical protein
MCFSVHLNRRRCLRCAWLEKCLAHEQRGVRAVYNKAEYAEQRREMLQAWADMLDGWIATNPKMSVLAPTQPVKTREYIS